MMMGPILLIHGLADYHSPCPVLLLSTKSSTLPLCPRGHCRLHSNPARRSPPPFHPRKLPSPPIHVPEPPPNPTAHPRRGLCTAGAPRGPEPMRNALIRSLEVDSPEKPTRLPLNLVAGWVLPNGCFQSCRWISLTPSLCWKIQAHSVVLNHNAFSFKLTLQSPKVRSKLGDAFTRATPQAAVKLASQLMLLLGASLARQLCEGIKEFSHAYFVVRSPNYNFLTI